MKKKFIFLALIIMLLIAFYLIQKPKNYVVFENGKKIYIEIADSKVEHENGLMFRESLDKDKGMFFIFDDSAIRYFWMKNTYIPLDIIFIDENFTIINIAENVPLCIKKPCQNYPSLKPIKYVLEVNAGVSKENGLNKEDKINLNLYL
jgi:uncharacterized protein